MTFQGWHPQKDVEHMELRRQERAQRLHRPYGREMSPRSRAVALAVIVGLGSALLALVVYAWGVMLAG